MVVAFFAASGCVDHGWKRHVDEERGALLVRSEGEIVREVQYIGLSVVSMEDLVEHSGGMHIRAPQGDQPGTTFDERRASTDVQTILDTLRERGKHFAEVDVHQVELESGVKVNFWIREGPTVLVDEIEFIGNDSLDSDELRRHTKTQSNAPCFFRSDHFDRRTVDDDVESVERYYQSKGFPHARAFVDDIAFIADRSRANLKLRIVEGKRLR